MSLDLFYRDPYMLDFLGLRDTYSEKDLERILEILKVEESQNCYKKATNYNYFFTCCIKSAIIFEKYR